MKETVQSRQQRRFQERVKADAEAKYAMFRDKILDAFTASDDPEGQEMTILFSKVDSQWRTYCKHRNLIPSLYPAITDYTQKLIKDYQENKTQ